MRGPADKCWWEQATQGGWAAGRDLGTAGAASISRGCILAEFSVATPRAPPRCLARPNHPWQKGLQVGPLITLSWARNLLEPGRSLYWSSGQRSSFLGQKVPFISAVSPGHSQNLYISSSPGLPTFLKWHVGSTLNSGWMLCLRTPPCDQPPAWLRLEAGCTTSLHLNSE